MNTKAFKTRYTLHLVKKTLKMSDSTVSFTHATLLCYKPYSKQNPWNIPAEPITVVMILGRLNSFIGCNVT